MECRWYTKSSIIIKGAIKRATLPGGSSCFSIFDKHAPILGMLKKGKIYIETDKNVISEEVSHGYFKFQNNMLTIISDS